MSKVRLTKEEKKLSKKEQKKLRRERRKKIRIAEEEKREKEMQIKKEKEENKEWLDLGDEDIDDFIFEAWFRREHPWIRETCEEGIICNGRKYTWKYFKESVQNANFIHTDDRKLRIEERKKRKMNSNGILNNSFRIRSFGL